MSERMSDEDFGRLERELPVTNFAARDILAAFKAERERVRELEQLLTEYKGAEYRAVKSEREVLAKVRGWWRSGGKESGTTAMRAETGARCRVMTAPTNSKP